jgi:hypothetical protein
LRIIAPSRREVYGAGPHSKHQGLLSLADPADGVYGQSIPIALSQAVIAAPFRTSITASEDPPTQCWETALRPILSPAQGEICESVPF